MDAAALSTYSTVDLGIAVKLESLKVVRELVVPYPGILLVNETGVLGIVTLISSGNEIGFNTDNK
jgi:hypothetical protein